MFGEVVRSIIVLLCLTLGYQAGKSDASWLPSVLRADNSAVLVCSIIGAGFGYLIGGVVGRVLLRIFGKVEERVERAPVAAVAAGTIGGLIGLAAGMIVMVPALMFLPPLWGVPLAFLAAWILAALGYRLARVKTADLLSLMGLSQRYLPQRAADRDASASPGLLLDSSAVIDGRLLGIVRAGFCPAPLLLPRFVLEEIQSIADASDARRRRRGRRGLEILDAVQAETELIVLEDDIPSVEHVDAKLVQLAKRLGAGLMTTDFNLQRVAELQGIEVRNVNRLAELVRPPFVAGDDVRVRIEALGTEQAQGVGYTDDGTMVVVADAAGAIGEIVDAVVSSAHQTSAGRMLFARIKSESEPVAG